MSTIRLLPLTAITVLVAGCGFATVPAVAQNLSLYGAIAYSASTGTDGFGTNYASKALADSAALRTCSAQAPDCVVVVSFIDGCGALAQGRDGGWGVAAADMPDKAMADALANCAQFTVDCAVTRWHCTG